MKLKDFPGKILGPFAFKFTFYALLLKKKNVLSSIIPLQRNWIKRTFSKLWSFPNASLEKNFAEGGYLQSLLPAND